MGRQVIVSESAQGDLRDIVTYVSHHNQEAAVRLGNALIDRAEILSQFAELGRIVPEFSRTDLRELRYRSYRIIYRAILARGARFSAHPFLGMSSPKDSLI